MRCINHLEAPDSGRIVVDGIPLDKAANINAVRAEIGMVFQSFNLFPHLSVLDNLTLAQKLSASATERRPDRPRASF